MTAAERIDLVAWLREREQYIMKRLLAPLGNALFVVEGDAALLRKAADALESAERRLAEAEKERDWWKTTSSEQYEAGVSDKAALRAAERRLEAMGKVVEAVRYVCNSFDHNGTGCRSVRMYPSLLGEGCDCGMDELRESLRSLDTLAASSEEPR